MNFYLAHLHKGLNDKEIKSIHIMDNNFYTQLSTMEGDFTANNKHKRAHKFTKNINVFEKDIVVVPVCEENHWYLILIINHGVTTVR